MRRLFVKDYGNTMFVTFAFCGAAVAGIADPGRDMRISRDRHRRCRLQRYPDSFADPFSGVLVWGGDGVFAGSFAAVDFSPAVAGFWGASFLAASL